MKQKNLVSLTLAASFTVLSLTGLWLFAISHNHIASGVHLTFGLVMLSVAAFHIKNNWGSIKKYSKLQPAEQVVPTSKPKTKIPRELFWAGGIVGAFIISAWFELPPLGSLDAASDGLRGLWKDKEIGRKKSFREIETLKDAKGTAITLQFEKSKAAQLPLVTCWLVDSSAQFIETIFVPSKVISVAADKKNIAEAIREGEIIIKPFETTVQKTFPEATPLEDFIVHSKVSKADNTHLKIEVNDGDKKNDYDVPLVKNQVAYKVHSDKTDVYKKIIITLD